MASLTNKQRVMVNAALSMIYAEGYDAAEVRAWADDYQRKGYDARRSFEQALNDFAEGQPDLAPALGKITRLVEASDVATVAKYDQAISRYIATGDDAGIAALGPMIARDSVALAVRNGEVPDGSITAENVESALGFSMADDLVLAANQPEDVTPPSEFAFRTGQASAVALEDGKVTTCSQVSAFAGGGRMAKQEAWDSAFNIGSPGTARTMLSGRVVAPDIASSQT